MRISDWSSDVCSSDLWRLDAGHQSLSAAQHGGYRRGTQHDRHRSAALRAGPHGWSEADGKPAADPFAAGIPHNADTAAGVATLKPAQLDRKSTRLNSSH